MFYNCLQDTLNKDAEMAFRSSHNPILHGKKNPLCCNWTNIPSLPETMQDSTGSRSGHIACHKKPANLSICTRMHHASEHNTQHTNAHPHSKAEHGEAHAVAETGRGQEPCPRRRGGLAADVVDYQLGRLSLALCTPRPFGPALLPQRAVENHDQLQAPLVQTRLRQGGQVA